jgi:hypothetical protein
MSPDTENSQENGTQPSNQIITVSAYSNGRELSSALPNEIYEKFGIIVLSLRNRNIFDSSLGNVCIFDYQVKQSQFSLHRTADSWLQFTLLSTRTGIRVASLKLLQASLALGIVVTWSDNAVDLFAGDFTKLPLTYSKGLKQAGRVRQAKNGRLFQVPEGVKYACVRQDGKLVFLLAAKELWDLTVFKIQHLVTTAKNCIETNGARSYDDFLLESSVSQQCFIMLVKGFEVYTRERFLEIEKEMPFRGIIPRFDLLLNKFTRDVKTLHKVFAFAEIHDTSLLEAPVSFPRRGQRGLINFQNWDDCKRAYNLCYNIKFGEIPDLRNDVLERVQGYLRFRHKIIHSSQEATILNVETVPQEEPVFVRFDAAQSACNDFREFIEKLHIQTENVSAI